MYKSKLRRTAPCCVVLFVNQTSLLFVVLVSIETTGNLFEISQNGLGHTLTTWSGPTKVLPQGETRP